MPVSEVSAVGRLRVIARRPTRRGREDEVLVSGTLTEAPPERADQDCAPTPAPEDLYAMEREVATRDDGQVIATTSTFAARREPARFDLISWHLDTRHDPNILISTCPRCNSIKVVAIHLDDTSSYNCLRCQLAWSDPMYVPKEQVAEIRGYYGAPES